MKKVVLINQSIGYLMIDIANAFAEEYDEVVLVAGEVKPMERNLNPKIKVQKIIKYNRNSIVKRFYTWTLAFIQVFFLLFFRYRQHKIVYVSVPPMIYFLGCVFKRNFIIVIYDIYPDALVSLGIGKNNFIYRFWSKCNRKVFPRAEKIITLSEGMSEILSEYVKIPNKLEVVNNWSGSERFAPYPKEKNPFVIKQKLQNKFIVMYSGNHGYSHDVEPIIEVARKLKNEDDIFFLFIGEGGKKEKLIQKAKDYNLQNCRFLTWQRAEVLPYSLAAADLSVVSVSNEIAKLSVPSKTYNILAVGSPLLCIAPDNSELCRLVKRYGNGECFEKEEIDKMASFVISLAKKPENKISLSKKSLIASKDFDYSNAKKYLF